MSEIEYFLSPTSPFTYLAGARLERIAEKHGVNILYRPFDIMAVFARTGGTPPGERHPSRQAYRLQEIRRVAATQGMEINLKPTHWPTNPAPAAYAIIAAQNQGGGDLGLLVRSFLAGCWQGELNIADDDVIRGCLGGAGFDPGLADRGLVVGAETFAANTEAAVNQGVFGAPTYLVDDQVFWGQDRLGYLDTYLADRA